MTKYVFLKNHNISLMVSYKPVRQPQVTTQSVLFFFFTHRCHCEMTVSTPKISAADATECSGSWGAQTSLC